MELHLNKYGVPQGVVKFGKVLLWAAASAAVAAVGAKLQELDIQPDQITAVAAVGLVNAILAGIGKYLVTNQPSFKSQPSEQEIEEQASPLIAG